jgi:hypothetical protein
MAASFQSIFLFFTLFSKKRKGPVQKNEFALQARGSFAIEMTCRF